jgi:hypothetical protein
MVDPIMALRNKWFGKVKRYWGDQSPKEFFWNQLKQLSLYF